MRWWMLAWAAAMRESPAQSNEVLMFMASLSQRFHFNILRLGPGSEAAPKPPSIMAVLWGPVRAAAAALFVLVTKSLHRCRADAT